MSTSFLKKYKVIRKIGEGSFSEVLKCQDRITGIFYAGKRLKKTYESIEEILESPEIIAMRKISRHQNVLYMIESHFDPLPGKVTLIFDLMDMNLYDLIKRRKNQVMSEQKVKLYLYQLLKGLEHLHKHGMFHRDIKPENILLKDNVIKLADLGSIHEIYSRPPYTEYISTRWYRSPECILTDGYYGPKMDIWAVGCVFYELLTLKPLFPGYNEVDQISKIHTILGSPHAKLIAKFRRRCSRNYDFFFPSKEGIGFTNLLPHITETGKELLKLMLIYDPRNRSDIKELLEHRYFNNLKNTFTTRLSTLTLPPIPKEFRHQWTNASLVNYLTSEKHQRHKPVNGPRFKLNEDEPIKLPKIVKSTINTRPNVCHYKSNHSDFNNNIKNNNKKDSNIYLTRDPSRISQNSWRSNMCPLQNEELTQCSMPNVNLRLKLPLVNYSRMKVSQVTGESFKYPQKRLQSPSDSQYDLVNHDFYPKFKRKYQDKIDSTQMNEINQNCSKNVYISELLPMLIPKSERCRLLPTTISAPRHLNYKNGRTAQEKRKKLNTISETHPAPHTSSSNIKSPAKKIAKHETTSKSVGKSLPAKKNTPKRLRGCDRF